MSKNIPQVKGVQDILPPEVYLWRRLEELAREVFEPAGFREVRLPILEHTQVFARSIGETSDIVEKEMYTFEDRGGRSLTMRPEGTASVVRSFVEKRLHQAPPPQKFYYMGPMFRYERPQRGRYRQFHQVGVEAFGQSEPALDAEVIAALMLFLERVGLEGLVLELNSIGCPECRPAFREALVTFFEPRAEKLCADCRRRLGSNPLRILDCKQEGCRAERQGAPNVTDHLCEKCEEHFEHLKALLSDMEIDYRLNPEMVRGLDYYTRTAFEVTSSSLGSQNAVAAGGRYDRLVKEFGGPDTPAVGFAMGLERLVALMAEQRPPETPSPLAFIATLGAEANRRAWLLTRKLRAAGLAVECSYTTGSLKNQLRKADRLGAGIVFILGDDELAAGSINMKDLESGGESSIALGEVQPLLEKRSLAGQTAP